MDARHQQLRVGLVGAGWMGHVHADAWLSDARASIVGIADSNTHRAEALAARIDGGIPTRSSLRELLADVEVDAVDICLPHDCHAEAVVESLLNGMHVLCEKPLCLNLDEAESIRRALEQGEMHLMCAHNKLYTPSFLEAQRRIRNGAVGDVVHVNVTEAKPNLRLREGRPPVGLIDPERTYQWRLDRARMGGAQLIDTGWHAVYRLLALVDSRPIAVAAFTTNHLLRELDGEDSAQIIVRFASGVQGSVLTSWAFGHPGVTWEFEIFGLEGTMVGDSSRLLQSPPTQGLPGEQQWEPDISATFGHEIRDFISVVRGEATNRASWNDGVDTLRVILAAYESSRRHEVVPLLDLPYGGVDAIGAPAA